MAMMRLFVISMALLFAAMVSAQEKPAAGDSSLAHVRHSFVVMVNASYADTAILFSPVGERAWAGTDWNPQFLYPRPERDEEGAVFTVKHGGHESVWVNSIRDMESRHFQYVYFIPDALVTVIDVRFFPISAGTTKVEVTYTRTALNVDANPHVRALGVSDAGNGTEWQQAIEKYLKDASSRTNTR
jgi:hypothetical protein